MTDYTEVPNDPYNKPPTSPVVGNSAMSVVDFLKSLGIASAFPIGTGPGTVAAGDDSRIVKAASVEQAFIFSLLFG